VGYSSEETGTLHDETAFLGREFLYQQRILKILQLHSMLHCCMRHPLVLVECYTVLQDESARIELLNTRGEHDEFCAS
jgi:hypothetical protein